MGWRIGGDFQDFVSFAPCSAQVVFHRNAFERFPIGLVSHESTGCSVALDVGFMRSF
jgi:hypothetical protein